MNPKNTIVYILAFELVALVLLSGSVMALDEGEGASISPGDTFNIDTNNGANSYIYSKHEGQYMVIIGEEEYRCPFNGKCVLDDGQEIVSKRIEGNTAWIRVELAYEPPLYFILVLSIYLGALLIILAFYRNKK